MRSSLFLNHSQRMTDLTASLLCDVGRKLLARLQQESLMPVKGDQSAATILICSLVLLRYGQAHPHVFRQIRFASSGTPPDSPVQDADVAGPSSPRGKPAGILIIPVLLGIGERVGFAMDQFAIGYHPGHRNSHGHGGPSTPSAEELERELSVQKTRQTERRLGPVLAELMYELCRVQKLEREILALFNETRIGRWFEMVELTRDLEDETFNYNLIKLIVSLILRLLVPVPLTLSLQIALNEQFMVAGLPGPGEAPCDSTGRRTKRASVPAPQFENVVLRVMKERLDESKTFGENLIFILNRSSHETAEGLCVSLLILKILYLLFTTTGTHDYFYTNDLCVLVDVFIRELNNLPEESEGVSRSLGRLSARL